MSVFYLNCEEQASLSRVSNCVLKIKKKTLVFFFTLARKSCSQEKVAIARKIQQQKRTSLLVAMVSNVYRACFLSCMCYTFSP